MAPAGWTITSFFQVVEKPNTGIGCVNTYDEALDMIGLPTSNDKTYIHAAYLQAIGISNFDYPPY